MQSLTRIRRAIAAGALLLSGSAGVAVLGLGSTVAGATPLAVTLFASPGGSGSACSSTSACSFTEAVSTALGRHGDAVTIHLASGSYPIHMDLTTDSSVASLAIVGAGPTGAGASVLTASSSGGVLQLHGSAPVSISAVAMVDGQATDAGCLFDVKMLEAASESLKTRGSMVYL